MQIGMSEKRMPHYPLEYIHQLINEGNYTITLTAEDNAAIEFNYDTGDIIQAILLLEEADFYKSM